IETRALLNELVKPPSVVRLGERQIPFTDLFNHQLGDLDPEIESLFHRFAFCRIFAKLYFGYGFANLSVLTGINHLAVLITLLRLELKMRAMRGEKIDLFSVAEIVRMMERRLTQAVFSRETSAVLEIL